MKTNDYIYQFRKIKTQIFDEIVQILGENNRHDFKDVFTVHYISGDTATNEVCVAVQTIDDNVIVCTTLNKESRNEDNVYHYDASSCVDILERLKDELKVEKVATLRNIVKKAGGNLTFNGDFDFYITDGMDDYVCELRGLKVKEGKLEIIDTCDGDLYSNEESELSFNGLDNLIKYVEEKTTKTFNLKYTVTYSRPFEIKAHSYEEAIGMAKKLLDEKPIEKEDKDSEEWT